MAGKRISATAIDWASFAARVPEDQMMYFRALKGRNDSYTRRVAANPESLPKIDWNYYKSKINVPGMVENFQKTYESLTVPYPTDQGLISKIDEEGKKMKDNFDKFVATIQKENEELRAQLDKLNKQIKYSEMTVEEFYITNPQKGLYPVCAPTLFPHGDDERKLTQDLLESGKL